MVSDAILSIIDSIDDHRVCVCATVRIDDHRVCVCSTVRIRLYACACNCRTHSLR